MQTSLVSSRPSCADNRRGVSRQAKSPETQATRRLLAGNEATGDRKEEAEASLARQPKQETKTGRGDRRREANASRGKTNARRGKGSGTGSGSGKGSGKGKGKEAWYRET